MKSVYLENRSRLERFLRTRLNSATDAEEVVQDMWFKLGKFNTGPINDPLAYLFRMANNAANDRRRSASRQLRRDHDWSEAHGDAMMSHPVDETPDAEAALLAREQLAIVEDALAQLPERTGYILREFRIEGHSQRHIAGELGISVSAVEKHLQKAYVTLVLVRQNADWNA